VQSKLTSALQSEFGIKPSVKFIDPSYMIR